MGLLAASRMLVKDPEWVRWGKISDKGGTKEEWSAWSAAAKARLETRSVSSEARLDPRDELVIMVVSCWRSCDEELKNAARWLLWTPTEPDASCSRPARYSPSSSTDAQYPFAHFALAYPSSAMGCFFFHRQHPQRGVDGPQVLPARGPCGGQEWIPLEWSSGTCCAKASGPSVG